MKKYIVALGVSLFLVSGIGIAYASHSWGGYHWARTANPLSLKLGKAVTTSAWNSALNLAATNWSTSTVLDMAIVQSSVNPRTCKATNGRVEVCNSKYGQNGWLGIAQIWITGTNHITQGTVKLNDTYFNTATYNKPEWRNLVTCQEIGHTLGLDHQDEIFSNANLGTCMDYTSTPSTNQSPNQHDYDELAAIYAHLDTTNTAKGSVSSLNARDVDVSQRSDWGKAVAKDRKGRESQFVRNLGNGDAVVTHVFWAE